MSTQKLVRVDYRLIHGQIVAQWVKVRPVNRIIVANDELYNDEFMSDIYRMAAPQNEVEITKIEDLKETLDKKDDKVMVIFKTIDDVKKALEYGIELLELNIGAVQSTKDRIHITSGIDLSKNEYLILKELENKGINVYLQSIPNNEKIKLGSIGSKFKKL